MTIDLRYLVYTAMLTAALWIPYIVCQVRTNGPLQPANYIDPAARPETLSPAQFALVLRAFGSRSASN